MSHCINTSSQEFKSLLESTGLHPELLKANIAVWQEENNKLDEYPQDLFHTLPDNQVVYALKSVDILFSDKAKQVFFKGQKANWDLNKILSELQIPKEQKQIILDKNITNREEIVTSLLADNSFTVEINIAKSNIKTVDYVGDDFPMGAGFVDEIETKELNNTNYYFNLTVPGGTNYTENEIATPLITPSIKGHAQFATDNGIGWFRSDDKSLQNNIEDVTKVKQIVENRFVFSEPDTMEQIVYEKRKDGKWYVVGGIAKDENGNQVSLKDEWVIESYNTVKNINKGTSTKTRRILEVQSDLFQKGRNKENLVKDDVYTIIEKGFNYKGDFYIKKENTYYKNNKVIYATSAGIAARDYIKENVTNSTENQFLQRLNKDNNWVTFFIKSIIQDSARKGYEKVLFPSGNTASKVEGHTTLEEFKKEKEDRIKELEKEKFDPNNPFNMGDEKEFNEGIQREINQLKQELERVEGPEGFGALKPIYNFYENTVTNILNKTYGKNNVNLITDEYGNTWNEVTIDSKRDLKPVQLSRKLNNNLKTVTSQYLLEMKDKIKEQFNLDVVISDVLIDSKGNAIKGKIENGVVYLSKEATLDTPIHEVLHPFLELIKQNNKALYRNLVRQITSTTEGKAILKTVTENYKGDSPGSIIDETIVTLAGYHASGLIKDKSLLEVIRAFFKKLATYINQTFGTTLDINTMNPNMTIRDLGLTLKDSIIDLSVVDLSPKKQLIGLLNSQDSNKLINRVASKTIDRIKEKPTKENLLPIISKVIEEIRTQNLASNIYDNHTSNLKTEVAKIEYAKKRGRISASLNKETDVSYIVNQVIKDITSMYYNNDSNEIEDNEEDSVDSGLNFEQGVENSGGWMNLSSEIRSFIYFTTYDKKEDEAGNIIEEAVEPLKLYKTLQSILADTEPEDMFAKLEAYTRYDDELNGLLIKLKNKIGYNPTEITVKTQEQSNFLTKFYKNFENTKLEYTKVFQDRETGDFKLNSANKDTNVGTLRNQWKTNYLTKYENLNSELINKHLKTLDLYTNIADYNSVTEKDINTIKSILNDMGIELQDSYLEYSFNQSSDIANQTSDIYKITIADINRLLKHIDEGKLLYKLSEDDTDNSTMDSYIYKYAQADMNFRTSLIEDSYRSSDGKLRNSYVKQNFITKKLTQWKKWISKNPSIIDRIKTKEDSYYKYNYLFNSFSNEQIQELFNEMKLSLIGDVTMGGENYTTKSLTSEAFWVMQKALYNNRTQSSINADKSAFGHLEGSRIKFALVDFGKISDKNTELALRLPVNENFVNTTLFNEKGFAVNKNDTFFSNEYLETLYNTLFLQEYNKLRNYNSPKALKDYTVTEEGEKVILNKAIIAKIKDGNAFTVLSMLNNDNIKNIEAILNTASTIRSAEEDEIANAFKGIDISKLKNIIKVDNIGEIKEDVKKFMDRILTLDFRKVLTINNEIKLDDTTKEISNKDVLLNTANQYANNFILRSSFQQIVSLDLGITKSLIDDLKRTARLIAYGDSGNVFNDKDNKGNNSTYKVLYTQPATAYKVLEDNIFRELTVDEQKLLDADNKKDIIGLVEIDSDDGQAHITVKHFKESLNRLGKLPTNVLEILDKIDRGEIATPQETAKIDLISMKGVHGDSKVYLKMSESVLTKQFTSVFRKGKWVARLGREELHNKREFMERNNIGLSISLSGSKIISADKPISKDFFKDDTVDYSTIDNDVNSTKDIEWQWWREQQINESGKTEISSPVQLNQLIDYSNNVTKEQSDLIQKLLIEQREDNVRMSIEITSGKDSEGNDTAYGKQIFLDNIEELAKTSGADDLTVEILGGENGNFKYSANLPTAVNTFIKYFTSFFNKGTFSQKIPGYKCTLVTANGLKIVRDKQTGSVIMSDVYESNPKKYPNAITDKLKIHQDSNPYAEVLMTKAQAEKLGLQLGDVINEDVFKMLGVRIPTQGYSSMIPFKVVDFLPEYYGSTIIAPEEIVFISGADYDVDSLFIMRKLAYRDKGDNLNYYSYNDESVTQRYNDYKHYQIHHNKYVKSKISELQSRGKEKEEDINTILSAFGYPTTMEEFKKAEKKLGKPLNSKAGITNKLLSTYLDILTNPEMLKELHKPVDNADIDKVAKYLYFDIFKKGNKVTYVHQSDTQLQEHYISSATGKRDVGAAANGSSIGAILKRAFTYLAPKNRFIIDGYTISNFGGTTAIDFDIQTEIEAYRSEIENTDYNIQPVNKSDVHTGLINITVDNQNNPIANMINLDVTNTGIASAMVNTGLGKGYFVSLINYPLLPRKVAIGMLEELQIKASEGKDVKFAAYLKSLDKNDLTSFSHLMNKRNLVKGLLGRQSPLEQIAISLLYANYAYINSDLIHLGTLAGTTKVLGSTFEDIDNVYTAEIMLEKLNVTILNIKDLLEKNPYIKYNINKVKEVDEKVFSREFITRTNYFKKLKNSIEPSFDWYGIAKFESNYLGYLISSYLNNKSVGLLQSKKDLANPNSSNNIVKKYIKLKGNPEFAGNIIVQYLNTNVSKDTGASIFINQFLKLNSKSSTVFSDAFRELLNSSNEEIKNFGVDCFYHMIIKDNLSFTKETFSRLLPPKVLKDVSQALTSIHQGLYNNDESIIKEFTGFNIQQLNSNYVDLFGTNVNNAKYINYYSTKKLKSEGLAINIVTANGKKVMSINTEKNTNKIFHTNNVPVYIAIGSRENNSKFKLVDEKGSVKYYEQIEPTGVTWLSPYFQTLEDNRKDYIDNVTAEALKKEAKKKPNPSTPVTPVKTITKQVREYTPENITSLKPNEVFVFGANTVGGHGGGTAGLAQRGTTSSNYTALSIGTKGKWSEYGIVDKLMQGTEGKSFGIVTKAASISGTSLKIGAKRSVPLSRIEESINALIKTANENPSLKFLVTKFGTNMAGFSEQEMKSLLENKNLPDNVILPKEFEVRGFIQSTTSEEVKFDDLEDVSYLQSLEERPSFEVIDKKSIANNLKNSSAENKESLKKIITDWVGKLTDIQRKILRKSGFTNIGKLYDDFKVSGYNNLNEYFDYLYQCKGL